MTGKLLTYHLKSPRIPLVVRVPQFDNHCPMLTRKGATQFYQTKNYLLHG